ncbi:MAG TPA: nitroreductase family deazaflavin-dependent oxidoreductase [Actinomycetota bacterium]|nr:nitroreductase family deazaflavin-dependent oxidoreductase [Actinomycetota bacterium]
MAFDPSLAGEVYCYLTTTGRRTGEPHTIEIWFGMPSDGRALYLLSGGGDRSDWVRNLVGNPKVDLRIGTQQAAEIAAIARVVEPGDEDAAARELLASKYQGWDGTSAMSSWARTALCVAIEPA